MPPPACLFIARGRLELGQGNSWAAAAPRLPPASFAVVLSPGHGNFAILGWGLRPGFPNRGGGVITIQPLGMPSTQKLSEHLYLEVHYYDQLID